MRHKVLVETTVLVSGSVYSAKGNVVEVKHPFFDRSMKLFTFLKTHRETGMVTQTVEREASNVLEKAVAEELGRDVSLNVKSVVLDLCWDRLRDILTSLDKVVTDQKSVDRRLGQVVMMYANCCTMQE